MTVGDMQQYSYTALWAEIERLKADKLRAEAALRKALGAFDPQDDSLFDNERKAAIAISEYFAAQQQAEPKNEVLCTGGGATRSFALPEQSPVAKGPEVVGTRVERQTHNDRDVTAGETAPIEDVARPDARSGSETAGSDNVTAEVALSTAGTNPVATSSSVKLQIKNATRSSECTAAEGHCRCPRCCDCGAPQSGEVLRGWREAICADCKCMMTCFRYGEDLYRCGHCLAESAYSLRRKCAELEELAAYRTMQRDGAFSDADELRQRNAALTEGLRELVGYVERSYALGPFAMAQNPQIRAARALLATAPASSGAKKAELCCERSCPDCRSHGSHDSSGGVECVVCGHRYDAPASDKP